MLHASRNSSMLYMLEEHYSKQMKMLCNSAGMPNGIRRPMGLFNFKKKNQSPWQLRSVKPGFACSAFNPKTCQCAWLFPHSQRSQAPAGNALQSHSSHRSNRGDGDKPAFWAKNSLSFTCSWLTSIITITRDLSSHHCCPKGIAQSWAKVWQER